MMQNVLKVLVVLALLSCSFTLFAAVVLLVLVRQAQKK